MARTIDPFETKRFCLQCSGTGLCPFSKRVGKNLGGGKHGISRGMVHGRGVPTMELKINLWALAGRPMKIEAVLIFFDAERSQS